MIWIKALHIIFMVAWFAGIFYLPRLFVNHAMSENEAVHKQLELMEQKLYRFITPWMVLTLISVTHTAPRRLSFLLRTNYQAAKNESATAQSYLVSLV
jgi:putative membrane protein